MSRDARLYLGKYSQTKMARDARLHLGKHLQTFMSHEPVGGHFKIPRKKTDDKSNQSKSDNQIIVRSSKVASLSE